MHVVGEYLEYKFCLTDNLPEFPLLKKLEQFIKAYRGGYDFVIEDLYEEARAYSPKNVIYLIIYANRTIVATTRLIYKATKGYINLVCVNPKYRGKKICNHMMDLLFQIICDKFDDGTLAKRIKTYELDVDTDNIPAIKCYEHAGFRTMKTRHNGFEKPTYVMVYRIN